MVCWGSSISAADRKKLDKVIKKARSVLGCPLDTVEVMSERRMNELQPLKNSLK